MSANIRLLQIIPNMDFGGAETGSERMGGCIAGYGVAQGRAFPSSPRAAHLRQGPDPQCAK